MSQDPRARARHRTHTRLAELVHELSGASPDAARRAVGEAVSRNGVDADNLQTVADAIISLRHDRAARAAPRQTAAHAPPRETARLSAAGAMADP